MPRLQLTASRRRLHGTHDPQRQVAAVVIDGSCGAPRRAEGQQHSAALAAIVVVGLAGAPGDGSDSASRIHPANGATPGDAGPGSRAPAAVAVAWRVNQQRGMLSEWTGEGVCVCGWLAGCG